MKNADTQHACVPASIYKGDSPLNCFFFLHKLLLHFTLISIFILFWIFQSFCYFFLVVTKYTTIFMRFDFENYFFFFLNQFLVSFVLHISWFSFIILFNYFVTT